MLLIPTFSTSNSNESSNISVQDNSSQSTITLPSSVSSIASNNSLLFSPFAASLSESEAFDSVTNETDGETSEVHEASENINGALTFRSVESEAEKEHRHIFPDQFSSSIMEQDHLYHQYHYHQDNHDNHGHQHYLLDIIQIYNFLHTRSISKGCCNIYF